MKVLFLALGTEVLASSRTRVYQYLPFLEQKGIAYRVFPYASARRHKRAMNLTSNQASWRISVLDALDKLLRIGLFRFLWRVPFYDIVFIQKALIPCWLQRIIKSLNPNIIFDFDDAIYTSHQLVDSRETARQQRLAGIIRMSKYVILENEATAAFARQFNHNIVKITGPIDTDRYFPAAASDKNSIVIGWVGSPPNTIYLKPLHDVFREICQKNKNVQIELVGGAQLKIDGARIKVFPWTLDTEVKLLQRFDIGIMPLPDDEWSRGKGGYKLLQYMALGIPCVASPVGINVDLIQDNETGFLANTPSDWERALSILIEDESRRKAMGVRGRKIAERDYSFYASFPRLTEVLEDVVRNS